MKYLSLLLQLELLLVFPLLLIMPKGGNTGFYLLVLTSFFFLIFCSTSLKADFLLFLKKYWMINLAMSVLFLITLTSAFWDGSWTIKDCDEPFRLMLFPIVLWGLKSLSYRQLKVTGWSYVIGAFLGTALLLQASDFGRLRPESVGGEHLIIFTDIVLLLGTLSIISIGNEKNNSNSFAIYIKIGAGIASLAAAYISETRGSWIALPFFILIGTLVLFRNKRLNALYGSLILIVLLTLIGSFTPKIRERIDLASADVNQFVTRENTNTSIGIRFQLWNASINLFKEHPLLGIGSKNFSKELLKMEERKIITTTAARNFFHSHNDILFRSATLGIGGLIAILSLYLIPSFYFLCYINSQYIELRIPACMGLILTFGYFIFGLTDCLFAGIGSTFYSIVLAIIFAQLISAQRFLNHSEIVSSTSKV